jgi:sulfur-oxidizing protein SoxB
MTYPQVYRTSISGERLKAILEDIADNLFNPDPYYQQGGDMVRCGGLAYRIDVTQSIGQRISDLAQYPSGRPIEPNKDYIVAGWASVTENVEGPPVWEVVERYVTRVQNVRIEPNTSVKVVGI